MEINEITSKYLGKILSISKKNGIVRVVDIADKMQVNKQTVNRVLKNLREEGFIDIDNNGNINLTLKGIDTANYINECYVTINNLFETIGVSEEIASNDASKIAHNISPETYNAIKELLHRLEN